jgi:dUTP pyrophosphatase
MNTIKIKKINDLATAPTKGSEYSAGYDLYSSEEFTLMPMNRKLFKTGLSIAIPNGLYGRIAPRSGLAFKDGIDVLAGVIDEDYRGEIGVLLINFGLTEKQIKVGDKIAQIIFEFYNQVEFELVDELQTTQRGEGGFGSTETVKLERPKFPENWSGPNVPDNSSVAGSDTPITVSGIMERWLKKGEHAVPPATYETAVKEAEKNRS